MEKIAGVIIYSLVAFTVGNITVAAEEWNQRFSLNGKAELRLEANDASVQIRAGDINWIEARVTTTGWRIIPSEVSVTPRQTGNVVAIDVRTPHEFFSIGNRSVHIDLTVPRQLALASIRTGDGRIVADGLGGEIRLNTSDGRIEATRMDGALEAETGDGRLVIDGRFDRINLKTNDGHVELKVDKGSRMNGSWRVQTGDGGVEIALADGLSCDLDAHTGDGHITVDLPVTASHQQGESTFRGRINGGGGTLTVRTGDGSIHLRRTIL